MLNDVSGKTFRSKIRSYKNGTISKIEISGHGHPGKIVFGPGKSGDALEAGALGDVYFSDDKYGKSFTDVIKNKLAPKATIKLSGCFTASELFGSENITKAMSAKLKNVKVKGSIVFTYTNEFGNPKNRDQYFRIGKRHRSIGFYRTYLDGKKEE